VAANSLKGFVFAFATAVATLYGPPALSRTLHGILIGGAAGAYIGGALTQPLVSPNLLPKGLLLHSIAFVVFTLLSLWGALPGAALALAAAWGLHGVYDLLHLLRCGGLFTPLQNWYLIACMAADWALAVFAVTCSWPALSN
jgi:hypothetical protein